MVLQNIPAFVFEIIQGIQEYIEIIVFEAKSQKRFSVAIIFVFQWTSTK